MAGAVRCRCGQAFRVPAGVGGGQVRCPACGVVGAVPLTGGPPPTPSPRFRFGLVLASLATLSVALGFLFLFLLVYWRAETGPEGPSRPAPLPPLGDLFPSTDPPKPAAPDPPEPGGVPPVANPPAVEVVRTEPAEPRAGEPFTILLRGRGADREGRTFQYRVRPDEDWLPARGKRVRLARVPPGQLIVEFRSVDRDGLSSPVLVHPWVVREAPAPAVAPSVGYRKGESFYQEVVVGRVSAGNAGDIPLGQHTRYAFLSCFTVQEVHPDGSLVVVQKVVGVKLNQADERLEKRLNALLERTKGETFTLHVSARGEVVRFEGERTPLRVFRGARPPGGAQFLVWSFLDRDGWKELAQLSFFRPPAEASRWSRPLTHSWGPLGSWAGTVHYGRTGVTDGEQEFAYSMDLAYRPGGGAGFPFRVERAEFRPPESQGRIRFDPARGRVVRAQERFHVRGMLMVTWGEASVPVMLDEVQTFTVGITAKDPWEKEKPPTPRGG